MAITELASAFVGSTSESISLSQVFTVTADSSDPTYLVLSLLDRDENTAGASGATGSLFGNGNTATLANVGGDSRSAGIVFTYQASTARYYSSTYGYLDQMTYTSSASLGDVTSLSLFGTNDLTLATQDAGSTITMIGGDPWGYIGSATVVTQPGYTGTVPGQATPNSIAAVADSFVGQAWNMEGCWVLASTIAAEAGASLPVQSTLIGVPGKVNGEWIVAFNGPAGQSGNWQSMVHAGEMIAFGTASGGGHITTCVSGSGSSAMLVDNITYVNGQGQVTNSANDGSSSDIIVASPHVASQEWSGVQASSVVIYQLDAPVVSDVVSSDTLARLASQSLAPLFSAADPGSRAITAWQVYDTATTDWLTLNGVNYGGHSAASALTASSLSQVSLLAGNTATTDTLEVRAYNGQYWGDWQWLAVTVSGSAPPPAASPPVLQAQTPNQTWLPGKAVSLTLPAGTFKDPQGEALSYSATLSNGQMLPSWLRFNATTDSFSGTAPSSATSLSITVTAKDTSGLSAGDTFAATVLGAPKVTNQTPGQVWQEGKAISLQLPANTFTDPQNQALSYTATLSNGQALPSWLHFNAQTETFTGTAPGTAQTLSFKVTATDTSGLASSETFAASIQAPTVPTPHRGIGVTEPTANQTWSDDQPVAFTLPANTFTDSQGQTMTFAAYEIGGPNVTSWLHFNPATEEFFGTPPSGLSGTVELAVMASDAQHMMAMDLFAATFSVGGGHATKATMIDTTHPVMGTFNVETAQVGALFAFHT